ncbi:methylamine utilization protein MauJ [Methylobacterium indicum]|uniref:methylamine utilization protein MauJ n=1 Tax=Methylobacterium indicum TaxID=1775910 RepID=UPI000A5D4FDA|nr:methylamine utilization protein MauJ [Methylobacterium indicum]
MKNKSLGTTKEPSAKISLSDLPEAGISCRLNIVPLFKDPIDGIPCRRKDAVGKNLFQVKAKFSKSPREIELKGDFGPLDGSSYVLTATENQYIEIRDNYGIIRLDKNDKSELSMATSLVEASDAGDARHKFADRLSAFFDRISYVANIPIFIDLFVVKNITTEAQTIFFVSPPRPCIINNGDETLPAELAPVYALYREAQNSNSPYYKVLCLYKIMEGLLGHLRTDLSKKARSENINIDTPKLHVPDHPNFPSGINHLIGQPIKKVFDNFFQKEFRDAMAHFNLNGREPINVSDPIHWARFTDVAFVSNLCARALIERHERSLEIFSRHYKK